MTQCNNNSFISKDYRLAVVIPVYKVKNKLPQVLTSIPAYVDRVFLVDDACPDGSANCLNELTLDVDIQLITHASNKGVGAAVMSGYQAAAEWGADIIVRLDSDGQMDPDEILRFTLPIANGQTDYVKGNRFFELRDLKRMPAIRLLGNIILSFAAKLMSGYWNLMDPTNGYTAIDARLVKRLLKEKIDQRYFFESDMLYHLSLLRAVIMEVSIPSRYEDEESSLSIVYAATTFPLKYAHRFLSRIFYNYYLRDFTIFSLELLLGTLLLSFGVVFGAVHWYYGIVGTTPATTGTVMLAALPIILGMQFVLNAISYDVSNVPKIPVSKFYDR